MTGHIFNLQKFCLHDGPGIRTTVFFKGCNLRCLWCANPESQALETQLTLDEEKCVGCGRCVQACPTGARILQNGVSIVQESACISCGDCIYECPAQAIDREGRDVHIDDILPEILKDKPFYDQSGGGVTFCGGEPLMQLEFATALARALHREGITVAIETAAAVSPARFRAFLKEIDYVYIDLKHYDDARHRAYTGAGNAQILENIRSVIASGLPYTVRIPIIPGCNDSLEDAACFASLLASMKAERVQLLPFHQFGEKKYSLLGMEYAFAGAPQLHREDLAPHVKIFESCGLHTEL